MTRFGLAASFVISLGELGVGGGGGSKIVDQTRKYMTVLQPSVTSEGCQNDFL